MKKQTSAFLAAFIITAIVAASMLVIGVNAAVNPNGSAASNSPAAQSISSASSDQTQLAQLQDLVSQYQAREQQYQAAISSYEQQLSQASRQVQMAEQVLLTLQSRGMIQIDNQGQIYLTRNSDDFGD